jgi:hypothetical protein
LSKLTLLREIALIKFIGIVVKWQFEFQRFTEVELQQGPRIKMPVIQNDCQFFFIF